MTQPRVGVVGLGLMGRVHARNLIDSGGRVVAGADISPDARATFADEFDVPTYEDHDALLEASPVDAVVVTTPNRFHEVAAVAALEAGCDVLVEKPLAHSLPAAERIVAAAEQSAGFCMVGFHNRFSPATTVALAYRDAGRLGEISHIEASLVRRRGIPSPGSWFTNEQLSGGGALIDIGVHIIHLALCVLDFPAVVEATGTARTDFGARNDYADPDGFSSTWESAAATFDVDDSVSAFIRCETGQTIAVEIAWASNRPPANELVVRGTEAGMQFELEGEIVELYETSRLGVDHYVTSEIDARGGPDGHVVEVERFLNSVATGIPPEMNTIEEAIAVQRVIDGLYRSSESCRSVALEASRPETAD